MGVGCWLWRWEKFIVFGFVFKVGLIIFFDEEGKREKRGVTDNFRVWDFCSWKEGDVIN